MSATALAVACERVKKGTRRGDHRSPADFAKQNLSPQGENPVMSLRKIRKTLFFGGRSLIAPTFPDRKEFFGSLTSYRIGGGWYGFGQ